MTESSTDSTTSFHASHLFSTSTTASPVEFKIRADRHELIPYEELHNLTAIGRGGFGSVFKAEYKASHVAVKVMAARSLNSIAAYVAEVETLKSIRHKNCLLFYGISVQSSPSRLCIVTELMDGSLADVMMGRDALRGRVLSRRLKLSILLEVAKGLDYLHSRGIVHNDIKPSNILVDSHLREVKIGDYGLSSLLLDSEVASAAPSHESSSGASSASSATVASSFVVAGPGPRSKEGASEVGPSSRASKGEGGGISGESSESGGAAEEHTAATTLASPSLPMLVNMSSSSTASSSPAPGHPASLQASTLARELEGQSSLQSPPSLVPAPSPWIVATASSSRPPLTSPISVFPPSTSAVNSDRLASSLLTRMSSVSSEYVGGSSETSGESSGFLPSPLLALAPDLKPSSPSPDFSHSPRASNATEERYPRQDAEGECAAADGEQRSGAVRGERSSRGGRLEGREEGGGGGQQPPRKEANGRGDHPPADHEESRLRQLREEREQEGQWRRGSMDESWSRSGLDPLAAGGGEVVIAGLTLQYASPEAILTGRTSSSSDMFSFALLCAEVLTNRPPPNGSKRKDNAFAIGYTQELIEENSPHDLVGPLMACLSASPNGRPTAADMVAVLAQSLSAPWSHIDITLSTLADVSTVLQEVSQTMVGMLASMSRPEWALTFLHVGPMAGSVVRGLAEAGCITSGSHIDIVVDSEESAGREEATLLLAKQRLGENVTSSIIVSRTLDLSRVATSSRDGVVLHSVLTNLPKEALGHLLEEAHRVLKPGGRIVLSATDWGTASIHTPPELSGLERKITQAKAELFRTNGYIGRELFALIKRGTLFTSPHARVVPIVFQALAPFKYACQITESSEAALSRGLIRESELRSLLSCYEELDAAGCFFAMANHVVVQGDKPSMDVPTG